LQTLPTSGSNVNSQLKQIFDNWDKNRNGHLDAFELGEAMKQLGEESTPETNQLMIEMFDKDKSGTVDFSGTIL
jgi:Ca2+-binding EF-hand superfamily protein